MSSDQVAKLAATIEALTGAVHFLIAERVAAQPEAIQGELLHILQRALSTPPRPEEALTGRSALTPGDLALWMPIVAAGIMDEVRRQIGRQPEGVTHLVLGRTSPGPASEEAESPSREPPPRAVPHF